MKDPGPLAFIVTFAGFLIAAAAALRALWAGKFLWDPDLGHLERSAVKMAGLITAIGLAVAFASFYGDIKSPRLVSWTIGVGAAALVFFLVDVALRQWLFVQCTPTSKRIVRGFRTNERTRDLLRDKPMARIRGDIGEGDQPPPSARAFFCSLPDIRDPDVVWTHSSQVAAIVSIILTYVLWSGLATNGLALAAMLASGAAVK
jgi:hypothetical protein